MTDVVFVGPGRTGTALALAFQSLASVRVIGAVTAHGKPWSERVQTFVDLVSVPIVEANHALTLCNRANVLFFTVPDREIQTVVEHYVDEGFIREGQRIVHTSGALGSDILHAVHRVGASALSFHPLQTFANPSRALAILRGATVAIEGDEEVVDEATGWIRDFGGIPFRMNTETKAAYHAAAVLASGALVALVGVAADVAGLPNGIDGLLPLVRGAVDNMTEIGIPKALTGPIERGDVPTVERHLEALQRHPQALAIYVALGRAAIDMAVAKGSLMDNTHLRLLELFQLER